MKRLSAVPASLAALCVLTLGLSGCNVRFSPYAAVVNGSEISQQQLRDSLSAIADNASYRCMIEAGGSSRLLGAGEGTFNSTFGAEVLSILIQDEVVRQHVVRLGLSEPSSVDPIALTQLQAAFTPSSGCPGSGASLMAAFPPAYRKLLLGFQADEDALDAHLAGTTLSPASLAAFAGRYRTEMALTCVSVIQVGTKAAAASLRGQILRGASFAALARAHSTDTSSAPQGGAIGCIPDTEFTAPLNNVIAALGVGRVSSPVSFSSNWLLLLVRQRTSETYAQLVPSLVAQEQGALNDLLPRIIRSAKVEVDPQYGTWSTKASVARVQPNTGPPARIVPNPGAGTGPKASS